MELTMARLVAVCRSSDYKFERRQIPLEVDDKLTMVIQFGDGCTGCGEELQKKELETFTMQFKMLDRDDIAVAMLVSKDELLSFLSQRVPCVGCRKSVERLIHQLVHSGHPALEPLHITKSGELSIKRDVLLDPEAIYALFYQHSSVLHTVVDNIPKSKKNKRCVLHSLDTHKAKTLGSWMDVWDLLSKDCREEVVMVSCESLLQTLDTYLRKHRFCSECKSKVMKAYNILVGELDHKTEKGYCPALYEGLRCCCGKLEEKHIHVLCETDFIAHLIDRAEPELLGSRRERHAKTLDIAQEEVLTCLGVHLYERLHKIWQKLRAEEQTWQILFHLGVEALRKNFEMTVEKKQGMTRLELLCQELLDEEQAEENRLEKKRQKRKKKRNKGKNETSEEAEIEIDDVDHDEKDDCKCDENTNLASSPCASCDNHAEVLDNMNRQHKQQQQQGGGGGVCQTCYCDVTRCRHDNDNHCHHSSNRSDLGYSSGQEGCESCSSSSSPVELRNGSDTPCSEGVCNHGSNKVSELDEFCTSCLSNSTSKSNSKRQKIPRPAQSNKDKKQPVGKENHSTANNKVPVVEHTEDTVTEKTDSGISLLAMLDDPGSGEEDEISEEEIRHYQANVEQFNTEREKLRETLRHRFACMAKRTDNGEKQVSSLNDVDD